MKREPKATESMKFTPKLLSFLVAGLVFGAGALVHASVPHRFVRGEALTAENLMLNFDAIDARVTSIETTVSVLEQASNESQTGTRSADLVYNSVTVTLTPGTWLVQGFASVATDVVDGIQLGLFNSTAGADFEFSRSGIMTTTANATVALHTAKVITVTSPTAVRLKAFRNGASTLRFDFGAVLAGGRNRITAVRLS